jgi:adenylate kinase family enzyme
MRRVMVIGCSGAGKSTLARKLVRLTGLPLIDLDGLHWRAGWVAPPVEEWRSIVASAVAGSEWIMDGNYAGTFDLRMPHADAIVWLDYPRQSCLWRVVKRTARNFGRNREGLPPGCPEHLDWQFLKYIWTFGRIHRPLIHAAIKRFDVGSRVFRLTSHRSTTEFLATIADRHAAIH